MEENLIDQASGDRGGEMTDDGVLIAAERPRSSATVSGSKGLLARARQVPIREQSEI